MVSLQDLLAKGYLPKELPSGFNSKSYAAAMAPTAPPVFHAGLKARQSCQHSLARPGMLVRTLMIPDPVHFFRLANLITTNYAALSKLISQSPYSLTKPMPDKLAMRAWVPEEPQTRAELAQNIQLAHVTGSRSMSHSGIRRYIPIRWTGLSGVKRLPRQSPM